MSSLRSFAPTDRFLAEIAVPSALKPGYVLLGDEAFLSQRCRAGVLAQFAPPEARDFSLHDLDLADTSIFDVLDRARTPSLMAPFQVFFVRNLKNLYTRGAKKEEFAAIDDYFRSPNPQALLLFVADHLHIPADVRRMDYQDKERFDRIRETLGDHCGMVELARVEEADAVKWAAATAEARGIKFDPDAARELVDALGADMMLVASELEKLCLYVSAPPANSQNGVPQVPRTWAPGSDDAVTLSRLPHSSTQAMSGNENAVILSAAKDPCFSQTDAVILSERSESKDPDAAHASTPARPVLTANSASLARNRITLGDVETQVLAAKQRSLYELTDAISQHDRAKALLLLHGLLNASDGAEDSAIGHLYMLARTFRQMLIILEKNVRDSRAIWAALWQGFRMPPFAADDLIRQARRYKSRRDLTRALRLIARADLELRSSPPDKRLVLERLVLALATEPSSPAAVATFASLQFAMEL